MTLKAFHGLFARIGERAGLSFPVHPHMLRHGCGYALANAGHDTRALQAWLGHKNIQHTVRYTELTLARARQHISTSAVDSGCYHEQLQRTPATAAGMS
jgi:type 1 fimbriae regulatory protein FimB/type 1 fimbriae regulatory protein FimE